MAVEQCRRPCNSERGNSASPKTEFPNSIGVSCDVEYQAERSRGGMPIASQQSTSNGSAAFVGRYAGESAFVTFECDHGTISQHGILVSFPALGPARSYFDSERSNLDKSLGTSRSLYDCFSSYNQQRLRSTSPERVREFQNTYSWPRESGHNVAVQIEFDAQERTWNVALIASRGSSACHK